MRWLPIVLVVSSCAGLDRVPVLGEPEVEACATDRLEDVVCTLDGDTFEVGACGDGAEGVRMLGVDAPEIAHSASEQAACWGPEAEDWLRDKLEGAAVRLSFDATCADQYGRTLAYVWIDPPEGVDEDPELVNEAVIREGHATVYEDFDDIVLASRLYSAEDAAREDNLGLWAECQ